jgi:hypothetical protein
MNGRSILIAALFASIAWFTMNVVLYHWLTW